jgi:transcriptional regulator with XRE-family HTH domain
MASPARRRPRPLLRTMIGEVLRRTRRAQGRTLADVSRAARVSVPYLSELERGRKEASSEVLAAICDALRIDLSELLAGVGRELAGERAATVIRLDSVRGGPLARPAPRLARPAPRRGGGDVVCLAA